MVIGHKFKDKHVIKIKQSLEGQLNTDEIIVGIFWANKIKPLMDAIIITNKRLLAVYTSEISNGRGFFHQVDSSNMVDARIEVSKIQGPQLLITTINTETHKYAGIRKEDAEEILKLVKNISGAPDALAISKEVNDLKKLEVSTENSKSEVELLNAYSSVLIGKINDATVKEIIKSSREKEIPMFIAGGGMDGTLVAFSDRCVVIKKGALTSYMAGSLGGGRTATFSYKDITGIEYNSGLFNGVLEILTPSYQGSANHDFWNMNKNSSPYQLSNTLPWSKPFYNQVRDKIELMKAAILDAKSDTQSVAKQPQPVQNIAESIAKLSEMHQQGILTDDEFASAKNKIISG